jgi:methenyltetrahydromethanopterin cyclohydrolase
MISVNERAAKIVRRMIADAEALGLAVTRLPNRATVVDAGVQAVGSLEAGRLFSEACMGGLGQVSFCELDFDGLRLPGVGVAVSHPPLACVAAQLAGWSFRGDGPGHYTAMGSGPARALWGVEKIFEQLGYRDQAEVAVLALEGETLPPQEVAEHVAEKCGISPHGVYFLVASVASVVGAVQVAARMVEAGLHKMMAVGFDIRTVLAASGTCPLGPLVQDPLRAIARANDAVLYGSRAWYTVCTDDALIQNVLQQLPSSASRDYGTSFYDLFQRCDQDFYKMDPLLFSVAEISINNLTSGRTFRAGQVSGDIVRRTLLA